MDRGYGIRKKKYWLVLSFAVIACAVFLSELLDIDASKIRAIGLLIAGLILWVSEAIPMSIATLLLIFFMPFLGLMDYDEIIASFDTNTSLFIMASSGITVAFSGSHIPNNIMAFIFKKTHNCPRALVFALGLTATLFSGFVSSLATCVLFSTFVSTVLNQIGLKPKESNFVKALMLVIPACSGIGGFISPAGTPANMLVMEILKNNGAAITFGKWCMIGFPISLITSVLFLTSVVCVIKPEHMLITEIPPSIRFDRNDIVIIITTVMVVVGWFLSGCIPVLNTTVIAMFGLVILFIPKFEILDMKKFSNGVNWDLVLTMGSVSVLMYGISKTGIVTDFADAVFHGILGLPTILILIIISMVICIIRAFIPTTTAVIALLSPMLIEIAKMTSIGYVSLLMIAAFWAASALLLIYTEPIYLITYKEGYYSQKDLFYVGVLPCIISSVLCSILIFYFSGCIFHL